jgi:DNA polymerase elongation subunit (family B)
MSYKIPLERIESFLHGFDDEKFIVNLEYDAATNTIYKIKEDPTTGRKIVETEQLKSFLWIKNLNEIKKLRKFYGNSDIAIKKAREEFGITIKALRHDDNLRLFNGFKYLVTCTQGHQRLLEFFKNGGIYPYDKNYGIADHFMMLKPVEQFLIGTGKRLFKGFEEYKDIHKMVFDLETTGLDPRTSRIFLIGVKDNRGFEQLLDTDLTDEGEIRAIISFFTIIDYIKPSIIGGYNSANFDWNFIFTRCEVLGINVENYAVTLKPDVKINRQQSVLKLGGEVEDYNQVNMFGYNIIDIIHSARRAQAIDSDMQSASLKYVCKYNKVAKKNRVYIIGDKIGSVYQDPTPFYFDDRTGSYCKTKPAIEYMNFITRDVMKANPHKVFIFGDNDERYGMGGQAKEMRGEPNAIGIRTKAKASHDETAYYTDLTFDQNKQKILLDIKNVMDQMKKGKTVVIPSSGIGTGLGTT